MLFPPVNNKSQLHFWSEWVANQPQPATEVLQHNRCIQTAPTILLNDWFQYDVYADHCSNFPIWQRFRRTISNEAFAFRNYANFLELIARLIYTKYIHQAKRMKMNFDKNGFILSYFTVQCRCWDRKAWIWPTRCDSLSAESNLFSRIPALCLSPSLNCLSALMRSVLEYMKLSDVPQCQDSLITLSFLGDLRALFCRADDTPVEKRYSG